MILAVDIGNSNIVFGLLDDEKTYFMERVSTDRSKTSLEYAVIIHSIFELYHISEDCVDGSIISSVVPPITNALKEAVLKNCPGRKVMTIGPGLKTGLNITIDNPAQLGSDLVVDAVAALNEYPVPAIVIDMGTATTFSVIDRAKNYIGGVIIPGVALSLDALSSRTSQLPRINLEAPKKVIGRNTIECMQSGIIFSNAAMIDGMIDRIEEELGEKATVVATGGLSRFITPCCKREIIYDDNLLIKGLKVIYDKNSK